MHIDKKITTGYFPEILIFFIFIFVGIISYKDYGISIDEEYHRQSGQLYYSFLKGLLLGTDLADKITVKEIREASKQTLYLMPAFFDVLAEFFIDILDINDTQNVFFTRHLINFIFFYISCFFFYLIILEIFNNKIYSIIGVLYLFFYPRIFGESFYNNKDIIFLSCSIILIFFSIKYLKKQNYLNAFLFGAASGLAFDIRIMALIQILTVYFIFFLKILDSKSFLQEKYTHLFLSIITTIFFIFIFWPYLWIDPVNNFTNFFSVIKSVTPDIQNFYMGDYYYSKTVPWHYYFTWILVTIPLCTILFGLISITKILGNIFNVVLNSDKHNHKFWSQDKEMYDYYLVITFSIVLFTQIKFGVSYDGWRHLYFLYPFIVIFFIGGFDFLISKLKIKKIINLLYILVIFEIIFMVSWIYKNHPYQYVFFNPFFKNLSYNNFELDYWGLSNRSSLEYIANTSLKDKIKVATVSYTSLESSLLVLNQLNKDKIVIVHDLKNADFIIDNYRKKWGKVIKLNELHDNFIKVLDISSGGRVINTIYKKIDK
tara:strand:+ start:2889 stop:4517 length:1629 start_codon:yes stop_codon:yes gene_type:complete